MISLETCSCDWDTGLTVRAMRTEMSEKGLIVE